MAGPYYHQDGLGTDERENDEQKYIRTVTDWREESTFNARSRFGQQYCPHTTRYWPYRDCLPIATGPGPGDDRAWSGINSGKNKPPGGSEYFHTMDHGNKRLGDAANSRTGQKRQWNTEVPVNASEEASKSFRSFENWTRPTAIDRGQHNVVASSTMQTPVESIERRYNIETEDLDCTLQENYQDIPWGEFGIGAAERDYQSAFTGVRGEDAFWGWHSHPCSDLQTRVYEASGNHEIVPSPFTAVWDGVNWTEYFGMAARDLPAGEELPRIGAAHVHSEAPDSFNSLHRELRSQIPPAQGRFATSERIEVSSKARRVRIESRKCQDCKKAFRKSPNPTRCSRCAVKFERAVAEPPKFDIDENVPSISTAMTFIYPQVDALTLPDDDVKDWKEHGDICVKQLIDAINTAQVDEEGTNTWASRQQKTLNQKAKLERGYSSEMVTARVRCLVQAAISYHEGGPQTVYAVGGDNEGYTENRTLKFSDRITEMARVLQINKRVVMDVIEGRGVLAFVGNPVGYHRRKDSNNGCNAKKKDIMDKGKAREQDIEGVLVDTTSSSKRMWETEPDTEANLAEEDWAEPGF